jgi:hypothetical protein
MRAIGLISIILPTIVLTTTDVRCRQSLVRDLYPTKLYLCHVRAMPSPDVRTWRMVSAQSVP